MTRYSEEEKNEICLRALEHFGASSQMRMLQEEAAELIQAVNKHFRYHNDVAIDNLAEEMADVEIMMAQTKLWLPDLEEKVEKFKEEKLERLERKLNRVYGGNND